MKLPKIHSGKISKIQLFFNGIIALIYISWWFIPGHIGNKFLYYLLFFGEIYHLILSFMFWYTIWPSEKNKNHNSSLGSIPPVDIFITVTGEPVDVVSKTIQAAKNIDYPNFKVYILNDGFVAKKDNWHEVELLAQSESVVCITRKVRGGAKAGNINNALRQTTGEIVCVFDADMEAYPNFLKKIIPYFQDEKVGFIQSPQYYKNHSLNQVTGGAWEQQEFFFGPIMRGKEKSNAAFICGTNFAVRRVTLDQVGGMNEKNIAEDFLTSLAIHQKKWKSYYVPEVLAVGLAPEDLKSYYKQQLRWARGTLEVLFGQNPLFKRGLTWRQRVEYLSSALFYFNGIVVVIDIIMPVIFLFTGVMPVAATTTSFALFFIPFMAANLYTLFVVADGYLTFRAIAFTQSSWYLQLQAIFSVIFKREMKFSVTSKKKLKGNFLSLVFPHLIYISVSLVAIFVGIYREGINPSVITNIAWVAFNSILFMPFIIAAFHVTSKDDIREEQIMPVDGVKYKGAIT